MAFKEIREQVTIMKGQTRLFGMLHTPVIETPCPLVICLHGFFGNRIGKHRILFDFARGLVKKGIACIRFDFSGSGESEGEFSESTLSSMIDDYFSVYDFVTTLSSIDKERIGTLGMSFGGLVAVSALAKKQVNRALALWAPVFDIIPWLPNEKGQTTHPAVKLQGKEVLFHGIPVGPRFLQELALVDTKKALERLEKLPIFHAQGKQDSVVTNYHKEQYFLCRKSATAPTKEVSLEVSNHDFSDVQERRYLIDTTVKWFSALF